MKAERAETENFIDDGLLWRTIAQAGAPSRGAVVDILAKAGECAGLDLFETAVLLENGDRELDEALFETARAVKNRIYGNRVVLFAPLYVTNECSNSCAYCGFRGENRELDRRTLTTEDIREEVRILEDMGHKRVLAVYGEHPTLGADWMAETIRAMYSVRSGPGELRRVNINCAPQSVEDFRTLKAADIGTYQCFQETYHRATFETMHTRGRKRDFLWRLRALHRAQQAGIDDVAVGALFGLFDPRFEVLGLLAHARDLEREFGVGPHTVSFPRLEPAQGADISRNPPWPVSDYAFKRIVAIVRLAIPYTGIIMSTRERGDMRDELLRVGVSQISAGSRTYPGAYKDSLTNRPEAQQFCVGDERSLDEVIHSLVADGEFIPSFCTSCYRLGRTGDHFMGLAKSAFIGSFCQPNALLTFREYLDDYASPRTREAGLALVRRELDSIADAGRRSEVAARLGRIEEGERDLCY
jgi:2-iminoacetate synthase